MYKINVYKYAQIIDFVLSVRKKKGIRRKRLLAVYISFTCILRFMFSLKKTKRDTSFTMYLHWWGNILKY